MKSARLNIVLEPEEKELAEQLAAEYSRRAGVETTLSSFVRHLIREAARNATGESELNQQRLVLPPIRRKRPPRPRPSEQLAIYRDQIKAIALAHHVTNVRVFGSTARGEDTSKSDLDLLVSPIQGETGSPPKPLWRLAAMTLKPGGLFFSGCMRYGKPSLSVAEQAAPNHRKGLGLR